MGSNGTWTTIADQASATNQINSLIANWPNRPDKGRPITIAILVNPGTQLPIH
jgi:hypothetical protein